MPSGELRARPGMMPFPADAFRITVTAAGIIAAAAFPARPVTIPLLGAAFLTGVTVGTKAALPAMDIIAAAASPVRPDTIRGEGSAF